MKRAKAQEETRVDSEDWPTFYTMVPEWVTFAAISDRAHRIYTILAAHLRRDTGSRTTGVIVQADLAAVVGLGSNPERVRRYIKELEDLGAVRVVEEWDTVRKIPITRYDVRFNPPPGFTGHIRVQDWQEQRRAARRGRIAERQEKESRRKAKAAGQPVTRKNEGHETRNCEGHKTRKNEGPSTDEHHSDETSSDDEAPSARSAGGVRSTTTSGSRARDAGSGSAATDKQHSPPRQAGTAAVPAQRTTEPDRLTRDQTTAVHAVEALLPPLLAAQLPYGHVPGRNRPAVLEVLETRTLDQIRERITRRWTAYGYEPAIHDGELRSAVGAALALIGPTPGCPDPSCEDGDLIDTGAACRACVQRKAHRRAVRLAGNPPAGAHGATRATCVECEHPFPGAAPEDGLCRRCRQAPADAVAALAARLEREAAAQREAEALEEEAQRRRARRAAEAHAAAVEQATDSGSDPEQAAADVEADAQLRNELLTANPWMADYIQEPATRQ